MVDSGTSGAIPMWLTRGENFPTTSLYEEAKQVRLVDQSEEPIDI